MSKKICFTGILLFLTANLMTQQWTLDSCLAYAIDNNKSLLSQQQNQSVANIDKKSAWAQLAPEVEFAAGLDYYWQIPIQTFLPNWSAVKRERSLPYRRERLGWGITAYRHG